MNGLSSAAPSQSCLLREDFFANVNWFTDQNCFMSQSGCTNTETFSENQSNGTRQTGSNSGLQPSIGQLPVDHAPGHRWFPEQHSRKQRDAHQGEPLPLIPSERFRLHSLPPSCTGRWKPHRPFFVRGSYVGKNDLAFAVQEIKARSLSAQPTCPRKDHPIYCIQ